MIWLGRKKNNSSNKNQTKKQKIFCMKIKTIFSQKQLNNQVCSNAVITDIISNDVQKIKEMIDSRQPNIK